MLNIGLRVIRMINVQKGGHEINLKKKKRGEVVQLKSVFCPLGGEI